MKIRSQSQLKLLGKVIVLSLVLGAVGQAVLPSFVREMILNTFISPVYSTFFNVLKCIAGPMIFLSVVWGIYGIGDVETLGTIGHNIREFVCISNGAY